MGEAFQFEKTGAIVVDKSHLFQNVLLAVGSLADAADRP
jgi:hypothetical protein